MSWIKLHNASRDGNLEEVVRQLEAGVPVNHSWNLRTPLHTASEFGHPSVVRLLLSYGASVDVDCQGVTPLCWAFLMSHFETASLLVKAGADERLAAQILGSVFDRREKYYAYQRYRRAIAGRKYALVMSIERLGREGGCTLNKYMVKEVASYL